MTLRIIAGKFKGRVLKTPKATTTRPTQGVLREALFNICQHEIEGASFLDLYAGSGAVGFEALSRGASHITLVEKNRIALSCIHHNIELLQVEKETTLLPLDAKAAIKKMKHPFDLIYIDPPYDTDVSCIVEDLLEKKLLKPTSFLFLEERFSPKKEIKAPLFSSLTLVNSRRFGIALLHKYTQTTSF